MTAEDVPVVEIPRPQENPAQAEEAARFILKNLYREGDPSTERLEEQLEDLRKRTTVAAFDSGMIVATGSLEIGLPTEAKLEDIAVLDRIGYRRIGLGSKIVRRLETMAAESGVRDIRFLSAIQSVAFYKKLGYTVDEAAVFCAKTLGAD